MSERIRRWIVIAAALLLAYQYMVQAVLPHVDQGAASYAKLLSDSTESPYRWRVLLPYLADGLQRISPLPPDITVMLFNILVGGIAITALLLACYEWLRRLYGGDLALAGTLMLALLALSTFYYDSLGTGMPMPDSILEAALFMGGILWLHIWVTQHSSSSPR